MPGGHEAEDLAFAVGEVGWRLALGRYSVDATIGIARRVPGYPGGERRSLA